MKYLYGQVDVRITIISAASQEEAEANFMTPPEHRTPAQDDGIEKCRFTMPWHEYPGDNPTVMRDQVLASFLNLMQKEIPFTPDAQPSNIVVPPGSLTITEETKISDHENAGND